MDLVRSAPTPLFCLLTSNIETFLCSSASKIISPAQHWDQLVLLLIITVMVTTQIVLVFVFF